MPTPCSTPGRDGIATKKVTGASRTYDGQQEVSGSPTSTPYDDYARSPHIRSLCSTYVSPRLVPSSRTSLCATPPRLQRLGDLESIIVLIR